MGYICPKISGVNMNFNVAANSLDQCIATFQKGNCSTAKQLILNCANDSGASIAFNDYLSKQVASANTTATLSGGFNQS
jgi:hypothetical protein